MVFEFSNSFETHIIHVTLDCHDYAPARTHVSTQFYAKENRTYKDAFIVVYFANAPRLPRFMAAEGSSQPIR